MKRVDDGSFDDSVLRSARPVLVKFSAPWCTTCAQLNPVISDLESSHDRDWSFVEVDVSESPALAARFKVLALPTFVSYRDGEATERISGKVTGAQLAGLVG